jgi:two-component system sensor histidine kinase/response regulator
LREECGDTLNGEALDALREIVENAKKMGLLIDNLLEFSRLGKQLPGKTKIDMNGLFNSVVSELKNTASPTTKFKIASMDDAVGDVSMLKQVALNLVSNAIKYSSKKKSPVIEIGTTTNGVGTAYFVKDNGAGFNMKYYDKLFGVFQRLHNNEYEGVGVGLAIVNRIITRHSGKIWAEGKENEGATFYFTLPNN